MQSWRSCGPFETLKFSSNDFYSNDVYMTVKQTIMIAISVLDSITPNHWKRLSKYIHEFKSLTMITCALHKITCMDISRDF